MKESLKDIKTTLRSPLSRFAVRCILAKDPPTHLFPCFAASTTKTLRVVVDPPGADVESNIPHVGNIRAFSIANSTVRTERPNTIYLYAAPYGRKFG